MRYSRRALSPTCDILSLSPAELTFIVFDRAQAEGAPPGSSQGMCGDANLFVLDDGGEGGGSTAEVMVMIGDPAYRRRGYAREAVLALMAYAARTPPLLRSQPDGGGVDTFVAKISSDNAASLALFTGKLGYTVHKVVPAFGETHVRRSVRGGGGGGGGVGGGPRHDTHVGGVPALQPLPSESAAFTAEVAGIELVALPFDNPELEQTEAHAGRGATQQC